MTAAVVVTGSFIPPAWHGGGRESWQRSAQQVEKGKQRFYITLSAEKMNPGRGKIAQEGTVQLDILQP